MTISVGQRTRDLTTPQRGAGGETGGAAAAGAAGGGIQVTGDAAFQRAAKADLERIASTTSGRGLLDSINGSGHTVTIQKDDGKNLRGADSKHVGWADWPDGNPSVKPNGEPGKSVDAKVGYDPALKRMDQFDPQHDWYDHDDAWERNTPADAILYHELVHANDATHGTLPTGTDRNGTNNFELTAVGLARNPLDPFSENTYRAERGLPARTSYVDDDDPKIDD